MIRKYFDRENRAALRATKRRRLATWSTVPVIIALFIVTWGQPIIWLAWVLAIIDGAVFAYLGSCWAHKDEYLAERPGPGY